MNRDAMRTTLRVTKALSDRQRLRILMMLRPGELCVCQIVEVLELAPSTISKHLSLLSGSGLVDFRKDGRWAYYRLPKGAAGAFARPILKWLGDTLKNDAAIEQDARSLKRAVACDPENLCRKQRERVA